VERRDLYRAVNERIQELTAPDSWPFEVGPNEYMCECGDLSCQTTLRLGWEGFAEIAARPNHYLVAPGHAGPDTEIRRRERDYVVVEPSGRDREHATA
jgi:hypothetical protein